MFIRKIKNKKDIYYYLYKNVRNGSTITSLKLEDLGKHSELILSHPDPYAYCKEYARSRTLEDNKGEYEPLSIVVDFSTNVPFSNKPQGDSLLFNVGYFFLQKIYSGLRLKTLFDKISRDYRFKYDINDIYRLNVFSRILNPASKRSTVASKDSLYAFPDVSLDSTYRALKVFADNDDLIQSNLYKYSANLTERNTEILYYDCTNYFFETEQEDPDLLDDDGDIIQRGLRKYGKSKEHRPNPIVGQGLFIDANGIPVAQTIYSGSMNEQLTPRPLESRIIRDFKLSRFIYCSDSGLNSIRTKLYNSFEKRHFVVTESLNKMAEEDLDVAYKDMNWRFMDVSRTVRDENGKVHKVDVPVSLEAFRNATIKMMNGEELSSEEALMLEHDMIYKRFPVTKTVELDAVENGVPTTKKIPVKYDIIVTFSKKYFIYERKILDEQINRAEKMLKRNEVNTFKNNPNDIKRLLKKISIDPEDGVVLDDKALINKYDLNNEKIQKEMKTHGFYALGTNLDRSTQEIFEINAGRWKIEDSFRLLKSVFSARPVYLQLDDHIKGHFNICFTALQIYRILENKLNDELKDDKKFTANDIVGTLKNLLVENMNNLYYHATYTCGTVLSRLFDKFKIDLLKENYRPVTLNKLLREARNERV